MLYTSDILCAYLLGVDGRVQLVCKAVDTVGEGDLEAVCVTVVNQRIRATGHRGLSAYTKKSPVYIAPPWALTITYTTSIGYNHDTTTLARYGVGERFHSSRTAGTNLL